MFFLFYIYIFFFFPPEACVPIILMIICTGIFCPRHRLSLKHYSEWGMSHLRTLVKVMVKLTSRTNDTQVSLAEMCFSNPCLFVGFSPLLSKHLNFKLMHTVVWMGKNVTNFHHNDNTNPVSLRPAIYRIICLDQDTTCSHTSGLAQGVLFFLWPCIIIQRKWLNPNPVWIEEIAEELPNGLIYKH